MSSIAALTRMDCSRCGPQTLHSGPRCTGCGKSAPAPRKTRVPRGAVANAEIVAAAEWRKKRVSTPAPRDGAGRSIHGKRA